MEKTTLDLLLMELKQTYEKVNSINKELKEITEKVHDLRVEVAALKTSSKIAGGMAGMIPAIIAVIISLYKK